MNLSKLALVTGATGFVGGHLATRLMREGWDVRLLIKNKEKLTPALCKADTILGNLNSEQALAHAVREVSVIFHCAANVATWDSAVMYNATNVEGVQNLLNAIKSENPTVSRLVHLSTMDVYGFPPAPCNEQCPIHPSGFGYGDSKRLGEMRVQEFCTTNNIPFTILRPGNVIGAKSQFIERIGEALTSGIMLTIDKGSANAGLLYIDNLLDYMLWAAHAENAKSQCYNVRDDYDVNWATFLEIFGQKLGRPGRIINMRFGVADRISTVLAAFHQRCLPRKEPLLHPLLVRLFGRTCGHSAEKIRTDSGLTSRIGFEEAMDVSARWFLDNYARR